MSKISPDALATMFVRTIRDWLPADKFERMQRAGGPWNRFCDADAAMDVAYKALTGKAPDRRQPLVTALLRDALAIASALNFPREVIH